MDDKLKQKFFWAVNFYHEDQNCILSIHQTQQAANIARLKFAKTHIHNFRFLFKYYLKYWRMYHGTEYPDYPLPSNQLILEQFLSETCSLIVEQYEFGQALNFITETTNSLEVYDEQFYQELGWYHTQYLEQSHKRKR